MVKLPAYSYTQTNSILINHEEEVKDSEEDVHCVEDSIRANAVLQLIDGDEGCALKEKVENDGGLEHSVMNIRIFEYFPPRIFVRIIFVSKFHICHTMAQRC